ncbi:hypothetical protein AYK20_08555 [Thermoplasmatales archaeon SG8-52-1]|nr:MAG: hypothetical protein AYK20_08555 [Thermoplasmatales archaeon SG8-52-1]
MVKKYPKELKQKIRKSVLNGKSKYQTAKDLGINHKIVYHVTQDLPSRKCGWPGIRGHALKLLQEIIQHGYVLSSKISAGQKYSILRKYFPNIYRTNIYNKSIIYLDDKASVAARAFLSNMDKKILSFQELKQITKTFGIELSLDEKYKFTGKAKTSKHPIIRRRDGGFLSSYCKDQLKIDDFSSKTRFFGRKVIKKSCKNNVSDGDGLLSDDDSLAFFYIRRYWPQVVPNVRLNL